MALLFKTVEVGLRFTRGSNFSPGVILRKFLSCFGLNFGAFALFLLGANNSDFSLSESFIGVAALRFIF